MELIHGKQPKAAKCLLYGPAGIGKSTFASQWPNPVFIDTEGGTDHMDVARTPTPTSWTMLLDQVKYFIQHPVELGTLVIDTADWAEKLCTEQICASRQVKSIEDLSYGRGYVYLAEEFGKLLNLLEDLRNKGVHILLTAHAMMRKFEQPDEMGAYDRWELKLGKKTSPLCKEWADMVLFANYKTFAVAVDDKGKKHKAQGGKRVMYTAHHPCWDAKNRHGLAEELPFDYTQIAHVIQTVPSSTSTESVNNSVTKQIQEISLITKPDPGLVTAAAETAASPQPELEAPATETTSYPGPTEDELKRVPAALADLMRKDGITVNEIMMFAAYKGHFPQDTPIENLPAEYTNGAIVANWSTVAETVKKLRTNVPF